MSISSRQNTLDKILNSLENDTVKDENLSSEVKQSFLDYAMSVITDRALPDIKDGLKPVHRRIIYSAFQENLFHDKKYKKSAALVGTVMGSYHPHGDASIYDALVRMAQGFSLRYPLIEGQGNFGSIDGDAPAAMRYTEARLSKLGGYFLDGINEECVDFVDNYDQSKKEPVVLPTLVPNLLINGSTGIAVGLATNIPPHNISEIIDASVALIKNPSIDPEELYEHIQGPDFPTGGEIIRRSLKSTPLKEYFRKGKGTFDIRSKIDVEQAPNKRIHLIIREIPYGVQKSKILERIVFLMKPRDKAGNVLVPVLADNIVDIRDESSGDEIRVVIECRVGVPPEVIINNLYKYTQLQKPYAPNLVLLSKGEPKTGLSLHTILDLYVNHQLDMLVKRTEYQRAKIAKRLHILEGRLRVIDDVLEAIKLITTSDNPEADLREKYSLSEEQQKDIFELRISRLKKLSVSDLKKEQEEKIKLEQEKIAILSSEAKQREVLISELLKIKGEFGDERRTRINTEQISKIEYTELFHFTQSIFFLTKKMYISQAPLDDFKIRRRGGSGVSWTDMYDDDAPMMLLSCHGKDNLLFFTNKGRVFLKKAYEMNLGQKWRLLKNMLQLAKGEKVINMLSLNEADYQEENSYLFFATKRGIIKKTKINSYKKVNVNGKIAITIKEGDELKFVIKIGENSTVCLASTEGKLVKFSSATTLLDSDNNPVNNFASSGRTAKGRYGINLSSSKNKNNEVVSASSSDEGSLILSISEKGIGKISNPEDFRETTIGKKVGVKAQKINERTGKILACTYVNEEDEILLMTSANKINRFKVSELNVQGRDTSGVILMRLEENEKIVYFTKNCGTGTEESADSNIPQEQQ